MGPRKSVQRIAPAGEIIEIALWPRATDVGGRILGRFSRMRRATRSETTDREQKAKQAIRELNITVKLENPWAGGAY